MDFVIIANAWQAGVANPTSKHRIAQELVRRGHRVLWVEGAGMRRPSLGSQTDRHRIVRKLAAAAGGARNVLPPAPQNGGALWVVSPLFVPLPSVPWMRRLNGRIGSRAARGWSRRLGFRDPVLINYVPVLADAMKRWPGTAVYHCVDRWDAFDMYDSAVMARMDEQCCRHADLVIASAAELAARCLRFNSRVHLVPHGVDHAHFAQALASEDRPPDLPVGRVAGFFGLISEWIDQALLVRLAGELPGAQIVLIGTPDVPTDRLGAVPNIHLLGPRPFTALPAYIRHFQAGLIPFAVNDLTRAVNPIKLREMLAAGCPVVSTALPEVLDASRRMGEGARRWLRVADDAGAFVAAVKELLDKPASPQERMRLSQSVASETWEAKVDQILALLEPGRGPGARRDAEGRVT